jgi:Methyltransferase domain
MSHPTTPSTGAVDSQSAGFWDERYGPPGYAYGVSPSGFLEDQIARLVPGMRVLVPGDGEGRNGVWLARQGLSVTTVDISPLGCGKARALARERGVKLDIVQADLRTWAWPRGEFDVVASVFVHFPPGDRPAMHARMRAPVKPGGTILIEAFDPRQIECQKVGKGGGPRDAAMLYDAALLRADFEPVDELLLEHVREELHDGRLHDGPCALVRGVFRVPAAG